MLVSNNRHTVTGRPTWNTAATVAWPAKRSVFDNSHDHGDPLMFRPVLQSPCRRTSRQSGAEGGFSSTARRGCGSIYLKADGPGLYVSPRGKLNTPADDCHPKGGGVWHAVLFSTFSPLDLPSGPGGVIARRRRDVQPGDLTHAPGISTSSAVFFSQRAIGLPAVAVSVERERNTPGRVSEQLQPGLG